MNYIFSFTFTFDDPDNEDEDRQVEMCFLLDEDATARAGYTAGNSDSVLQQPEPFTEWFSDTTDELEEEFGAVHDCFGASGDQILVAEFSTYEIDTIEKAGELMQRWRDEFIKFLGDQGVGPVVVIPDKAIDHTTDYAGDLRDLVLKLSSPTASSPRP